MNNRNEPDQSLDRAAFAGQTEDGTIHVAVGEEHIQVDKVVVEQVAARIKMRTQHYDVPVLEELQSERLVINRIPVDRIVADPPRTRTENDVMIIPVVEEVLVRQYRIVEEVHIASHLDRTEYQDTVVLRRQDVIVEGVDPDQIPPTKSER